ncbi:MAG: glycosyl transferase, partial [Firmicutes bacterium]|nr:glycosyl transferase [Bacillota bacterium]
NGFLIEESSASLAVLLARICDDKSLMRRVGKTAEDELYLSWEDSVARASRRYEVVMENYARGLYERPLHASDELFRLSGDFLDLLAEFRNIRRSMKSAVNAVNENMERYM